MTETPIPHNFKVGDKVYNKNHPEEHGEVVQVSYTGATIRVLLQSSKLYWYGFEELEHDK